VESAARGTTINRLYLMGEWDPPAKPVNIKKRRRAKILGIVCGSFVLLLIAAYFVVTSAGFLKAVVLPKVGAALNATITVRDASVSPFSSIRLTRLDIQAGGTEPLLRAEEVHARYSLWSILRGHIQVTAATIDSPLIQLVENADGSSNLDPILKSSGKQPPVQPAATKSSKPLRLDLRQVALKNVTLRYVKVRPGGQREVSEVSHLNFTAANIANASSGQISIMGELKLDQGLAAPTNGFLLAKLAGQFNFTLDADLLPAAVKGGLQLGVAEAVGPFREAAGLQANFDADLAFAEIRALSLRLSKNAAPLASVTASGPFSVVKREGRINLDLNGIDRQSLNLAGAIFGGDFRSTTVTSSNVIEMAQGGKSISVTGRFAVHSFSLVFKDQSTPTLDLATTYDITVDEGSKQALVQTLTIDAVQTQAPLLHGTLAKPMRLDWSGAAQAVEESRFDLALTGLDLADWRLFAAEVAPEGRINAQLMILAQQAGKRLKLDFTTQLTDFAARVGNSGIAAADFNLSLRADVDDFNKISLTKLDAHLAHQKQPALDLDASGQVDLKAAEIDLKNSLTVFLPRLATLSGNPDVRFRSGVLTLRSHVLQNRVTAGQTMKGFRDGALVGSLSLGELTGRFASYPFDRFEMEADCDVSLKNQIVEIKKFAATLRQAGQPGGALDIIGRYDFANTNGQATVQLVDLNQGVVRSFVASSLGSNQLQSVSISLNAAANVDAKAESSVKGELRIGNLLLTDPRGQFPKAPTTLSVKLDGTVKDDLAELRQCAASINQGALNGGGFEANGRLNLKNKVGRATLKLTDLNQNTLQPLLASALGDKVISSASINFSAEAGYDPKGDSGVKGEFQVLNLLVTDPKGQLPKTPLTAIVKLDGAMRDNLAEFRQFVGYVKQGDRLGGSFDARGNYHLANQAGQLEVRLTDLNQNALGPLLSGPLGDKQLKSVSINLTSTARYDARGESTAKTDLQVANLLIEDPSSTRPASPLALGLQLDGSLAKQIVDLRQCQLTLSETPRAKNQLQLSGAVDMTHSNTIAGHLKLSAESLDLTPWYDLFGGKKKNNSPIASTGSSVTPQPLSASKTEPVAIPLPVGPFVFDATIGRLYLRELEVADFITTVDIKDNKVTVEPFSTRLNDAPVNLHAFVNLGVAGYEYALKLEANRVPLEPIVNSFEIGKRGQIKGFVAANTDIRGQGITPASLQKNLSGTASFNLTNANLRLRGDSAGQKGLGALLSGVLSGVFKTVAVVLRLPDLTASPVEFVDASADVSAGTVRLRSLSMQSPVFQAASTGTILLADPLEASRLNDLPMDIALERNTAVKAHLVSLNTDPKAAYVTLPRFLKVGGTLGKPDPKADIAALARGAGTDALKRAVGGAATGAGVGSILGSGSGTAGAAAGAPAAVPAPTAPQIKAPTAPTNALPTKPGPIKLLK
jgi:uncharacterized protein involved in outer membrane biogenesis